MDLFNLKRVIWFRLFHLLPFLDREKTLGLQKFIKFFFGLSDKKAIKLEFCSLCNVRCAWCWMYYNSVNKPMGVMKYDNFKKFMDLNRAYLFKNKIRIVPFLNGETLLHPQIFDIFDDISKSKITMGGLHTNLSMDIDIERLMSFPIARFVVNIGGITKDVHEKVIAGGNFELVLSNIKKMISINKNIVFIKINPTKDNFMQLKDLGCFMKNLGGYPENTILSTTGFPLPSLASEKEKKEFLRRVVSFEISNLLRFSYYSGKDGKIEIKPKKKKNKCDFLIDSITYDGRFTICCHDQLKKINIGNAFKTSIENIKKSNNYKNIYKKARSKSLDFCKDCN